MSVVTVCLNGDHIYKQCVSERMCASANLNTERQLFPQAKEQIKKQQNWTSIKWRKKMQISLHSLCKCVCMCDRLPSFEKSCSGKEHSSKTSFKIYLNGIMYTIYTGGPKAMISVQDLSQ